MRATNLRHSKRHRKKVGRLRLNRFLKNYADWAMIGLENTSFELSQNPFLENLNKRIAAAKITPSTM